MVASPVDPYRDGLEPGQLRLGRRPIACRWPVPLNPSKTFASSWELCEGSTFLWNGMMLEFFVLELMPETKGKGHPFIELRSCSGLVATISDYSWNSQTHCHSPVSRFIQRINHWWYLFSTSKPSRFLSVCSCLQKVPSHGCFLPSLAQGIYRWEILWRAGDVDCAATCCLDHGQDLLRAVGA